MMSSDPSNNTSPGDDAWHPLEISLAVGLVVMLLVLLAMVCGLYHIKKSLKSQQQLEGKPKSTLKLIYKLPTLSTTENTTVS